MKTIDISGSTQLPLPQTWQEVADLHGVNVKTIERDRDALNLLEQPLSEEVLEEIRRIRRWCALGKGKSFFTHRNYVDLRRKGLIDQKLKELRIIENDRI
jgi:hypothetical protein